MRWHQLLLLVVFAATARPAPPAHPLDALSDASFSDALTASIIQARGEFWAVDSAETRFESVRDLWTAVYGAPTPGPEWRERSARYWAARPATLRGVTGSTGAAPLDEEFSRSFVGRLISAQRAQRAGSGAASDGAPLRCLNVGAGIGREAVNVLLAAGCGVVDLLEPQAHFMETAVAALPPGALGAQFLSNAEDHAFGDARYDVILIQWCSNYIADRDFADFFRRSERALLPGGAIVVKDNVSAYADGVYAETNSHIIRSSAYLVAIAELGAPGLRLLADEDQQPWVDGLFPMRALAFVRAEEGGWEGLGVEAAVTAGGPE